MAIRICNPLGTAVQSDAGSQPTDHQVLLAILLELQVMNEILQNKAAPNDPVDEIRADLMNTKP